MNKPLIAIILLLAVLLPIAACYLLESYVTPGHSGDTALFIEHINHTRGKLTFGNYSGQTLNDLDYVYDAEKRALMPIKEAPSGEFIALIGSGKGLSWDAGSGASNEIYAITGFPAEVDGMIIQDIADDGTVTILYDGSMISLAPGQRWENVTSCRIDDPECRMRLTGADIIRNQGFIKKTDIKTGSS